LAGKTAVLPVMTKRGYLFVQLGGDKSSKAARYFYTFMTISYLLSTCLTARQISGKRTLWIPLLFVIWK